MKKGILGRKVGMTQVFTTDGKLIPVTVVSVENNVITQIKTEEKDGYNAVQISAFNKKEKASNRAEMGHFKKANTEPKRFLKEIRGIEVSNYQVGQVIGIDTFEAGEIIDATGTSKGKGFAGVIKRHGVSRGPETHGSTYHRRAGSMGTMRPMRVLKGKKLAGHMGNEQVTIQNLEIIDIDLENNCILISGNIPGAKKSLVFIRSAVKGGSKNTPVELISYDEEIEITESEEVTPEVTEVIESEEVSEEVSSEVVEEETEITEEPAAEEVKEETPLEESKEAE